MQVGGTVQRAINIPRRGRRLEALLAVATILVIAAVMALLVWTGPLATGGAETANPGAGFSGSVPLHDDAGTVHRILMPQGAR